MPLPLSLSLFASLPILPSALLASPPTSFSGSRSPLFLRPSLTVSIYISLSLSLALGRTAARQYLGPGYPALRTALRRAAFALSQPEGKLIPRCSDGNVMWRVRRQRGFPPTRRRRKGGKRRKSTGERRGAGQIVDDVTGDDDDDDDDGKGVMETGVATEKINQTRLFQKKRIPDYRLEIVLYLKVLTFINFITIMIQL